MFIKTASTLPEYLTVVLEIAEKWKALYGEEPYMWYRGDRKGSNDLIPGAYWRVEYDENDPWIDFKQGALIYLDKEPKDEWDWYFLAQHYGLPTRLLDWTENPIAALYFALHDWVGTTEPTVWILEPAEYNRLAANYPYAATPAMDNLTSIWLPAAISNGRAEWIEPSTGEKYINENPLAIYPRRSNPRIAIQRGAFTIHGVSREAINALVAIKPNAHSTSDGVLARINLVRMDPDKVKRELMALGIRQSSLFPELENYVKELKEYHRCK